jgi:predicted homoserine dehydrogenase-like protein
MITVNRMIANTYRSNVESLVVRLTEGDPPCRACEVPPIVGCYGYSCSDFGKGYYCKNCIQATPFQRDPEYREEIYDRVMTFSCKGKVCEVLHLTLDLANAHSYRS